MNSMPIDTRTLITNAFTQITLRCTGLTGIWFSGEPRRRIAGLLLEIVYVTRSLARYSSTNAVIFSKMTSRDAETMHWLDAGQCHVSRDDRRPDAVIKIILNYNNWPARRAIHLLFPQLTRANIIRFECIPTVLIDSLIYATNDRRKLTARLKHSIRRIYSWHCGH